jgi:hypothetical protein
MRHARALPAIAFCMSWSTIASVPDQQLESGFGDVPSAYLTGSPAFSATLTTPAIVPAQLAVV